MAKQQDPRVLTGGDLEVVYLFETHDLLARIIGREYYQLLGDEVSFHTSGRFDDFFVHVDELLSDSGHKATFEGAPTKQSLLAVGEWFTERAAAERAVPYLRRSSDALREWLAEAPSFRFFASEINRHLEFPLSRGGMIHYAATLSKHRLLRLGVLLSQLQQLIEAHGDSLTAHELMAVRESFQSELASRLNFLGTQLVELLGNYFLALNHVIVERRSQAGTNDARIMPMPLGLSSDVFREMYASTLVFKSYDHSRIFEFTPSTPTHRKGFY